MIKKTLGVLLMSCMLILPATVHAETNSVPQGDIMTLSLEGEEASNDMVIEPRDVSEDELEENVDSEVLEINTEVLSEEIDIEVLAEEISELKDINDIQSLTIIALTIVSIFFVVKNLSGKKVKAEVKAEVKEEVK